MPRRGKTVEDRGLLTAALEGLEAQKQRIEEQIRQVQSLLGGRRSTPVAAASASEGPARKRQLSAAARQRIAAAQKRRWAEYRKKASKG